MTGLTKTQSSVKLVVSQIVRQKLNDYFGSESDRMKPQFRFADSAGLDGKTALIIIRWCSYETELDAVAN